MRKPVLDSQPQNILVVHDGTACDNHMTMDKTLQNTKKASINTKLPTCDDKGVFTDDDDTYRKHK
jgi:hypothetical protein